MRNLLPLLAVLSGSLMCHAQNQKLLAITEAVLTPVDETFGKVELLEHPVFLKFWDTHECHIDSIDMSKFTDTVLLPILDARHSTFTMPVKGSVSSRFGWRRYRYHYGTDFRLNSGDTVYAAFDGKVRYSQYNWGGYGNLAVIRHYNGLETYYAHLKELLVDSNEYVRSGDPIGLGGSTGRSTGPHLHFEIRYRGNPINPENILDVDSQAVRMHDFTLSGETFAYKKEINARRYHRVRSGETLYALARRYHTTVNAICRLNGIRSSSVLRIGQNLRVR